VTIRLPAGTYRLTLGPLVATDPAGVSIQGVSAARTIITSQGQIARVLVVEGAADARPAPADAAGHSHSAHAGAAVVVSLSDLALRGGTAPSWGAWAGDGGALLVADSADLLELSHVSILDSTATITGGGLFARGQVWATAVTFSNDRAGASGGGAAFEHSEAVVADSFFLGDSAGSSGPQGGNGGAIEDDGSALVLVYSRLAGDSVSSAGAPARGGALEVHGPAWLYSDAFVQDHAGLLAAPAAAAPGAAARSVPSPDAGGAVYLGSGTVSVADCTFMGDSAQGSLAAGGALFNAASLTVITSRFVGNAATAASVAAAATATPAAGVPGGGGAIDDTAELAMSGSVLSRNTASGNGGALSVSGSAVVSDSVLSWNRSGASGGAISDEGSLALTESTLSHNGARVGGGLYVDGSLEARGDAVVDNGAVGLDAAGGGIYLVDRAASSSAAIVAVGLRRSTIAGNVAPVGAGIAEEAAAGHPLPADISRSVISGNHGLSGAEQDCAAVGASAALFMTSRGGNVVGDTSCDLTAATDRQGPAAQGYWLAEASGAVRACVMSSYGSLGRRALKDPVVAMAAAPGNDGYWEVTADGGVFNFGSASWFGSALGRLGSSSVTGFAVTLDGGGYWLVTSEGRVFNFGDAASYGAAVGTDIVAMARSVDGRGYWLLAANGVVHAFGDARNLGQHAGITARAIAATPDGEGYWVAAADGAVYAFGDAEAYAGVRTTGVVALLPSADGRGYRLVNSRGAVFSLGDAPPGPKAVSVLPVTAAAT